VRFLSHHDMARAIERTAVRADLPLRYTEGFNPHPRMSLACPRPVGVASLDDLLVVTLEDTDEPLSGPVLPEALNRCAPRGVRFLRARELAGKAAPRPVRACYELPVVSDQRDRLQQRIEQLAARETWCVERVKVSRRRGRGDRRRTIDIKPLVVELKLDDDRLMMTLAGRDDLWARPGEVLEMLGLDARADLAALVRTAVDYQPLPPEDVANNT